jgi:hypothetical protein
MERWSTRVAILAGTIGLVGAAFSATPARAMEPARYTYELDFTTPDFLGSAPTGDPGSPQCTFPVTGTWHLLVSETDYFYEDTGAIKTAIARVDIVTGTLSNPLTGESVSDLYHSDMLKVEFAPDGSVTGSFENESRDDSYLHMAGHFVNGQDGTILKDVGRDFLPANRHPMDVTPLCDALS